MLRANTRSHLSGFTLVEMLVIAPIALLVITGFVALMVTMVGDVIVSRNQNTMTYDIQSALSTIEQDVRLSTEFLDTSGALPTPQGKNGATSAFTSTSTPGDLILGTIATDKNPIDPTRGFIYYSDAPFGCTEPKETYRNRIFFTTVIYTIRSGSLWRRTYVPAPSGALCQPPWQVNTCAPDYASSATSCKTNDSEILKNVKNFTVSYYTNPKDTVAISPVAARTASSIRVAIEAEQTVAGRVVNAQSAARSTKLSAQEVNLAPPDAPIVSGTSTGSEVTFSWPSVPTASSYIVQYNITGNGINTGWKTASDNTTDTVFTIPANFGDTISVKVRARNTTGASTEGSTATTIPLWTDCGLQNGWVNYDAGYEPCAYTITRDGVVMFKGHIKNGSIAANVGLFQLPDNLRPSTRLMFQMLINPNSSTRVDVNDDGWVRLAAGTSAGYVGLDGIYYIPKNSLYSWTSLTLQNGWTSFGVDWSPLQSTVDSSGRVHLRGLIKQGTYASGTAIAALPAGQSPAENWLLPARGDVYNIMQVNSAGTINARGLSSSYYSTQAMYYPASFSGWQNFTGTVAGNPVDNQLGNNWVAYAGGNAIPQYTKSTDGIVTIKGLIKSGTITSGTFIAKLPPGYRPKKTLAFSEVSNDGVARVDVSENGYIILRLGSATWTSINGISYMAEQ